MADVTAQIVSAGRRGLLLGMKSRDNSDGRWRVSREGWLDVGCRALIENGVDAVKIQPLAKHLKLSRASFYWFVEDRNALLEGWEDRTSRPLLAAASQYADTLAEAMLNVLSCFLSSDFDSRPEFAVRS